MQPSCQRSLPRVDLAHALKDAFHLMHSRVQLQNCHQLETGVHQVKGVFQHMNKTNQEGCSLPLVDLDYALKDAFH